MFPTKQRQTELQERFGVRDGQFYSEYRYKNMNWYLGSMGLMTPMEEYEWFCYGDIREEDVERVRQLLERNEVLALGWKDKSIAEIEGDRFRAGGGPWLIITHEKIVYDRRIHGTVNR